MDHISLIVSSPRATWMGDHHQGNTWQLNWYNSTGGLEWSFSRHHFSPCQPPLSIDAVKRNMVGLYRGDRCFLYVQCACRNIFVSLFKANSDIHRVREWEKERKSMHVSQETGSTDVGSSSAPERLGKPWEDKKKATKGAEMASCTYFRNAVQTKSNTAFQRPKSSF